MQILDLDIYLIIYILYFIFYENIYMTSKTMETKTNQLKDKKTTNFVINQNDNYIDNIFAKLEKRGMRSNKPRTDYKV